MIAKAMQKVGNDGVITVEEAKALDDRARSGRGHAVRPRLHLPLFHHRRRQDAGRAREPLHPHQREEALQPPVDPAAARSRRAVRQAAARDRRGRRGRGACHAGRQQAPRRAEGRRRQGARLRRPPQGHAPGHRRAHRRPGDLRGSRHQARERHPRHARPRQEGGHHQGRHHHRRRRRQEGRHRGARRPDQASRSRIPPPTTTGRSSRSGSPSCPAASP